MTSCRNRGPGHRVCAVCMLTVGLPTSALHVCYHWILAWRSHPQWTHIGLGHIVVPRALLKVMHAINVSRARSALQRMVMGGAIRLMCFFLCGRLRDCVGCYATAFVLVPRFWSLVLSAARIRKHVVGMHIMFDNSASSWNCQRCFVRCVLLNGCTSRVGVKAVLQRSIR